MLDNSMGLVKLSDSEIEDGTERIEWMDNSKWKIAQRDGIC